MLKKLILPVISAALLSATVGCNSKSDDEITYTLASSVSVSSFSLSSDKKVLDSLNNVFFSIDLVNAKIFNADSLPYGTKTSRLVPLITVPSNPTEVSLTYYCPETGRDSVVNYLTNSTDSIDFSQGPVKLTIKSQDGAVVRDYQIKVNVHQMKADSLAWFSMASAPLPSTFDNVKTQYTVLYKGSYYCFSSDGTAYSLSVTDNPYNPQWETKDVTLDFIPKVESLRATDTALYMLSMDGRLYTSEDFSTWTATDQRLDYLYGAYGDQLLGCVKSSAGNFILSYPSGQSWSMPSTFPVEGVSQTVTYTVPMGFAPQLVMIGGRLANGTLTQYAWSFDGTYWTEISTKPLPHALEYMTLVPYSLVDVPASSYKPKAYPVLLAMGGRNAQGAINRDVYYSRDWGMTWHIAPELVQLPDEFPTLYGQVAYEYATTMHPGSRNSLWTEIPVRNIPADSHYIIPSVSSRAIAPITEWQCPAIYLFGGRDYEGNVSNTVWRGVIYHFTFIPVQ